MQAMATKSQPWMGQHRAKMEISYGLFPSDRAKEMDDADLVAAVLDDSPLAAAQVWENYSSMVRRILRRSLGPSVDVEDAVQEVFLLLFRDIQKLRKPSSLRSFLIGITLHVATSEIRRRRVRRWLRLSDDGVVPEIESMIGEDQLEQREALNRLYHLLDRINTKQRLVFVLRYIEGIELVELSTILGCSLATTKRRVKDAISRVFRLAADDPALAPYLKREP